MRHWYLNGQRVGGAGTALLKWGGHGERGFALIAVLWTVLLAGLVLMGVQYATRIHLAGGHNELSGVQAHWLARAGVETAMAELREDTLASESDSMLDYWWSDTSLFGQVEMETGTYSVVAPRLEDSGTGPRYGLEDMGGRIHLNTVGEDQLSRIEMLSESQVAALLDWRDAEEQARSGGAGRGYYQGLRYPYEIRSGPYQTLHELRLVRGVDEEVFYGRGTRLDVMDYVSEERGVPFEGNAREPEDLGLWRMMAVHSYTRNETGWGEERVNVNEADAQTLSSRLGLSAALAEAIVEHREDNEFASLLNLREVSAPGGGQDAEDGVNEITLEWLAEEWDEMTVTGEEQLPGRLNLNTAGRAVLMTVPGMEESAVDAIVNYRDSSGGPFRSVGELLTGASVDEAVFEAVADRVTTRSEVYRVTAVGTSSRGIRRQIVAVVDRGSEPMNVLYWYQSH